MNLRLRATGVVAAVLALLAVSCASSGRFTESFRGGVAQRWTILREQPGAWRVVDGTLELRVLPGNMWGGANDARNIFVRRIPDPRQGPVDISARVKNRPTEQYEQVDIVWYYADSHQVKIGQELVDGQLSVVMGREENDRTRTLAIIPIASDVVDVRLRAEGEELVGWYRTPDMTDWREAGRCTLPVKGAPHVSLQAYQGPAQAERWARISHLRVGR